MSCPFAGMTRIRFKGSPRYRRGGSLSSLTGAPLGTAANVGPPGRVSTHCHGRSPHEASAECGAALRRAAPDFASLHPGYKLGLTTEAGLNPPNKKLRGNAMRSLARL